MSLSTPTLRNVGKLLSPSGADTHVFLEVHPCQDLQLLESVALDIGTPPGMCVIADATSFILLEQLDFDACIAGVEVSTLDADTSEWVRSRAEDPAHEWYGCVTEVALPGEGRMPTIVLGHYPRQQAEAIAEAISPKADIFVLNPKQVLISHAGGDLYHYQLRVPGDDEDTVLFVRAVDCDTGLEYAMNHLRTARALEPGSEICGINTGLVARVA